MKNTISVKEMFSITMEYGYDEANPLKIDVLNETQVQTYFYQDDVIQETIRCTDKAKFSAFRCVTFNPPSYKILNYKKKPMIIMRADKMGEDHSSLFTVHYHGYMQSALSEVYLDWKNVQYFTRNTTLNLRIINLSMEKVRNIDRKNHACNSANSMQLHSCVREFIESSLNCSLPWEKSNYYKTCSTRREFSHFKQIMVKLANENVCQPQNCDHLNTRHQVLAEIPGYSQHTTLQYYMNEDEATVIEEMKLYGLSNFLSDFGGFLGLLLGASVLSFFDEFVEIIRSRITR